MKSLKFYLYAFLLFVFFSIFLSLPYFNQLNSLFLDRLQGSIKPTEEIVIIGIDDKSLKELGAWPWDREIFAEALENIPNLTARSISLDILFLEEREGDEKLKKSLDEKFNQIVLASKYSDGKLIRPIFAQDFLKSGFVNLTPDEDGKIRKAVLINKDNDYSFAFATAILDQRTKVPKQYPNTVQFHYAKEPFKQISFVDLYQGKIASTDLRNKIILIGVTTNDLKTDVSDDLTDIFGRKVPGVTVHANIINSLIQNKLQQDINLIIFYPFLLIFSFLLLSVFKRFKKNLIQFLIFISAFLLTNIFGLLIFEFGFNFPFIQTNILLAIIFVYSIAYKYFVEQKENRFVQKAFSQYLNTKLLKQLVDHPEKLDLGGEKKIVTVLFSDIRGFTTLSEKMTPEELISFINKYLEEMCQIILKNNGTIDKFIGDAIMALWNAPLDDLNHKENAIKTALEMAEKLEEFNSKMPEADIAIGVGINSGEVVVGNVGSKQRFDYTVLGDNVNLASRIEGLTKKYGVNILVTKDSIPTTTDNPSIIFRLIDEVIVKGKETPVNIYQPLFDTPENKRLKDYFEKAFSYYQKGEFKKAKEIFEKLKNDKPSRVMLERITTFKKPPPIWHWEEK